jgi:hypothetical protein
MILNQKQIDAIEHSLENGRQVSERDTLVHLAMYLLVAVILATVAVAFLGSIK